MVLGKKKLEFWMCGRWYEEMSGPGCLVETVEAVEVCRTNACQMTRAAREGGTGCGVDSEVSSQTLFPILQSSLPTTTTTSTIYVSSTLILRYGAYSARCLWYVPCNSPEQPAINRF
jgi:hypothetical protein